VRVWGVAIACLLCTLAMAAGEAPRVELSVTPEQATVGDLLSVQVTVTAPPGIALTLPGKDADLGEAEVRAFSAQEQPHGDGGRQAVLTYEVVFWEVGERAVQAPPIAWRSGDGEAQQADRPKASVQIKTVLPPDVEDILDIRGPREIPLRWYHYVLAAAPVLAFLALLGVGIAALRRRRMAAVVEPVPPPLPPGQEALQALDQLAAEDLPGVGQIKEHYVRLSWIVRHYVERRWRLPALEITTGMLATGMRGSGAVPEEVAAAIVALLRRADLAKFAKHRPEADVARADVDEGRSIVRASRPPAVERPADSDGDERLGRSEARPLQTAPREER